MEAVAISVAQSALKSVVKAATVALNDEIGLLLGVHEEVSFIKEELEMMQAFLRAASKQNAAGETVLIWVKQVRDLAYEAEHCIQEASLHLKKNSCLPTVLSAKERHRIAKTIQVLKTRIEDVSKRNTRYSLIERSEDKGNNLEDTKKKVERLTTNKEAPIVGLKEPLQDVINLILRGLEQNNQNEHQQLKMWKVISVVGMGGLGKTTLVRKVYANQKISARFQCFAWVNVVHPFNLDEFSETLLRQLCPPESEEVEIMGLTIEGNKLAVLRKSKTRKEKTEDKVTKYLKDKMYLIVIDNLSNEAEWEEIKPLLPVPDEQTNCRIIVTTRSESLAKLISEPDDVHIMKLLSEDQCVELFFKTVFKMDDTGNEYGHSQDTEMKRQASFIIDKCGRLPLAIVNIGTCLASRPKRSGEWKLMHEHLTFEINNNPHLGAIKAVLTTSYDGLSYQLKSCFLYLCVFYNHKEIRRSRIIRRWMAEGYLMERRGITAEEIGEDYFHDLMGRNLIQPSETTTIVSGTVTRCNIHDLIYELIVAKSQDENVMSLLEDQNIVSMNDKVRNLVIAGRRHANRKFIENVSWSHMRSLTIFGLVDTSLAHPYARFLRVLDLEGTLNLQNKHLRRIGDLRFLRYLGLRGTTITKLPESLENLYDLETLDIRNTVVAELPRGIVKLKKLSYLRAGFDFYKSKSIYLRYPKREDYFFSMMALCMFPWLPLIVPLVLSGYSPSALHYLIIIGYITSPQVWPLFAVEACCDEAIHGPNKGKNFGSFGVKAPREIGKMTSLCNLGMVDIRGSKSIAKAMKNLTNLKKLGVTGLSKRNGKRFAAVIKELSQLQTLVLSSANDSDLSHCLKSLDSLPPSLKFLRSLKLYSPVNELPDWITKLENLEKMHLRNTKLEMNNVNAIGKLPNLVILCVSKDSFNGQELCFGQGAFPKLEALVIERMDDLTLVSFEESSMPRLSTLEINRCRSLCPRLSTQEINNSPSLSPRLSTQEINNSPSLSPRLSTQEINNSPSLSPRLSTQEINKSPSLSPRLSTQEINNSPSLCQGGMSGLKHLAGLKEILLKYKYYEKDKKKLYNENVEALKKDVDSQISRLKNKPGLRVMRY